jgi:hypothetical protein
VKGRDAGKVCAVQDGAPTAPEIPEKKLTGVDTSNCNVRLAGRVGVPYEYLKNSELFDSDRKRHTRSLDGSEDTYPCFKK